MKSSLKTPIGWIEMEEQESKITRIDFIDQPLIEEGETRLLIEAKRQLNQYFLGERRIFDLPLWFTGTPFQCQVWEALMEIPYGETRSYQEIAIGIGNPNAVRAVGMANNRNPLSIIIPCHRVVGKNGGLVGYEGGLDKKIYLLELEKAKYKSER